MLELTIYGSIGITKWESIIKYYGSPPNIMVMLVISDCRKYYGILSVLKLPFISACLCITASFHVSQITVYFGSPEYHGIISYFRWLFISDCQIIMASSGLSNHRLLGLPTYHGIYLLSSRILYSRLCRLNQLSWFVSYILSKYLGSSNPTHISARAGFMPFQIKLAAYEFDECPGWLRTKYDSAHEGNLLV